MEHGPETIGYLHDRAADAFKRQNDLEEAIWRSLPLLTGGLIAAGAIVANAAGAVTLPVRGALAWSICATLGLAVIAFGVAFWWLWQVVRPRTFDYPPDDEAIATYAGSVAGYHEARGVAPGDIDREVTRDVRAEMAKAYAKAARSAFTGNRARLGARNQVLLFLVIGFLLAFVSQALIFGQRLMQEARSHGDAIEQGRGGEDRAEAADRTAGPAAHADRP